MSCFDVGLESWHVGFVDGFTFAAFALLFVLAVVLELALTEIERRRM